MASGTGTDPENASLDLPEIEAHVSRLSRDEKLQLIEDLVHQLRIETSLANEPIDWDRAYGIAPGLWEPEGVAPYIARLRDEWQR